MISILIPIYNGIEFIDQAISSVFSQSYQEWEIIIGINGHEEKSEVYKNAKRFERDNIKVLDLYTISNKANALNKMLEYTTYDWIALLDVDDKWNSKKLEFQIPFMEKYDIIGTKCKYFGNKKNIPKIPEGDLKNFNFKEYNPIINSSCLVRKKLCWWNPTSPAEDYDLWLRLREKQHRFYNVPEILVLHRIHSKSFFNSTQKNNLEFN
jgi:glycosyltransferase involved in cell wall biosynthesis